MEISLNGKTALIAGAGSGIGRAIALAFAELKANVVIADIDAAKGHATGQLVTAAGGEHLVTQTDVRDPLQVRALMHAADQRFGGLEVLVNNVGHHLGIIKKLEATSDDEIDALYHANLRHMFVVTRAALPLLRRSGRGASIINVSSIEGFRGCPTHVAYTTLWQRVWVVSRTSSKHEPDTRPIAGPAHRTRRQCTRVDPARRR